MANEKETKFVLSAETKTFIKSILEAKDSVSSLGDARNLDGLVNGLLKVGAGVGVLGAAFFAAKTAVDAVFDAEAIRQINVGFEQLTQNAGVATETLKNGLIEASAGLIDDTDLLKSANKALVEMGDRAERIPEVMELARKATAVFGGDLQANFEQINTAIATGNTRMLRHLGLKIDARKAEEEYARSIGTTVGSLSEAGKQQAIMNAVLETGKDRFKGVDSSLKEATDTWTQFKVTINQVKEVLVLAFEKVAGPAVKDFLKTLRDAAKEAKTYFTGEFGEGAEKAAAKIKSIQNEINDLLITINRLEKFEKAGNIDLFGNSAQQLAEARKRLQELQTEQAKYSQETKKNREEAAAADKKNNKDSVEDAEKAAAERIRIQKLLLAAHKDATAAEQSELASEADVIRNHEAQRFIIEQESALKIEEVRNDLKRGRLTSDAQVAEIQLAIESEKLAKLATLNRKYQQDLEQAAENNIRLQDDGLAKLSAAFDANAQKAKKNAIGTEQWAKMTSDSIGKHYGDTFRAIGEGSKDAAEAVKGFIFGVIADQAEAQAGLYLWEGLAEFNPIKLVASAGLFALSGLLRSQAKGSSSAGVSGSGAGGVAPAASFGTRTDERPSLEQERAAKSVNITVQGNYFETEQTKTALVDMIRQNQDATDYKILSVGGGI